MAGIQDFQHYEDDFFGASVSLPTSADIASPWVVAVTKIGRAHV